MSASSRDPRRNPRTNGSRTSSSTRPAGNLGEISTQVGGDGPESAVGIGGGLTVDSSGDIGLRVAPGVSVQVTPDPPSTPDNSSYGG